MLPRVSTAPVATRGQEVLVKHATQIETNSSRQGRESGTKVKAKRKDGLQVHPSPIHPHATDTSANHAINHDQIRLRAYEIYLQRGRLQGHELEDWLQAERECESVELFLPATTGEKHTP